MSEDAQHYEPMTEQRAREILGPSAKPIGPIGEVGVSFGATDYATWRPGDDSATLDGTFTPDEIEAIAWWMRNKQ